MTATPNNIRDASLYDKVPYPNRPQRIAHPRHLEAVATLFGMDPQPVPQCAVLELGSATGMNLIAQAYDLPKSKFLGIDFSEVQIAEGQNAIKTLGLENIELRHANIMDVEPTWGQFDYIICPGVYSWTPPEVQAKILAICKANLAPRGVAFVSYNVYPGWHFRVTIRDMMLYHISNIDDPQNRIEQARAVLNFLADSCPEDDMRSQLLKNEFASVGQLSDAFLFHEYLEANNSPVYFHQFAERARAEGLQYLGEADVSLMFSTSLPKTTQETLDAMGDLPLVRREQYMDYVRNREFRATLLCHEDIELTRQLNPNILEKFHLSTTARFQENGFDINGTEEVELSIGTGRLRTGQSLIKAAFVCLNDDWPLAFSLSELQRAALDRLSPDRRNVEAENGDLVARAMMSALVNGMVEFSVHAPQFVVNLSDYPVASALARQQAAGSEAVLNLRHGFIRLDALARFLIGRLDGSHDRNDLVRAVKNALDSHELTINRRDSSPAAIGPDELPKWVDHTLRQIGQSALLIA